MESEEDELKSVPDARQLAASAAGKSSWTKYPPEQIAVKREQADRPFPEPAFGSGQFRAVLRSAVAVGSGEAEPATGCEPSLFLVGRVRPLGLNNLTRNRRFVTSQSYGGANCAKAAVATALRAVRKCRCALVTGLIKPP